MKTNTEALLNCHLYHFDLNKTVSFLSLSTLSNGNVTKLSYSKRTLSERTTFISFHLNNDPILRMTSRYDMLVKINPKREYSEQSFADVLMTSAIFINWSLCAIRPVHSHTSQSTMSKAVITSGKSNDPP